MTEQGVSIFEPKLQELGRIRIGDKVKTSKGGTRPVRLETFRLTSENKPRLHFAQTLYGGEITEWEDAPVGRQWQLITETNFLPVSVPPNQTISQAWEQWSASGCKVRCNGEFIFHAEDESLKGMECQCPVDPAERRALASKGTACNPVTRLSVLLYDVPGIGVWRLDTGGYYAGSELMAIVPFLQAASAEGRFLNCELRLETRQVKRGGQTMVYPVVTLQPVNITLMQLLSRQIPDEGLIAPPQIPHRIASRSETLDRGREAIGELIEVGEELEAQSANSSEIPAISEQLTDEELCQLLVNRARALKLSQNQVKVIVSGCGGGETSLQDIRDQDMLMKISEQIEDCGAHQK